MDNGKSFVAATLDSLKKAGAQKAQCCLVETEKQEFSIEANKISLLRTTFDVAVSMTAIRDFKKGSVGINQKNSDAVSTAVQQVMELVKASPEDSAFDIAESQPSKQFSSGPHEPDLVKMYNFFSNFLNYTRNKYPQILFDNAVLYFIRSKCWFQNSNGVDFFIDSGLYNFSALFTAKDGKISSSFNHTEFSTKDIVAPLHTYGSVDMLLQQTCEQLNTKCIEDKFIGDIVMTPDCLQQFLYFFVSVFLSDRPLIAGTSIYKDKLGEIIADKRFSLHSCPLSPDLADNTFITHDGYAAQDFTFIERGVLKQFALSLYGSKKTGKPRAPNDAMAFIVDAGDKEFKEIIKSVKRGILLSRFSGGYPGESGEFSGVAKNSYYIENGEICFPLKETMISGNLAKMWKNIVHISKERINFGSVILPWIQFGDITISGK